MIRIRDHGDENNQGGACNQRIKAISFHFVSFHVIKVYARAKTHTIAVITELHEPIPPGTHTHTHTYLHTHTYTIGDLSHSPTHLVLIITVCYVRALDQLRARGGVCCILGSDGGKDNLCTGLGQDCRAPCEEALFVWVEEFAVVVEDHLA